MIVTQEDPLRTLDLILPPSATRVSIPVEFLQPGEDHSVEVLAREASGNQTIAEAPFTTAP